MNGRNIPLIVSSAVLLAALIIIPGNSAQTVPEGMFSPFHTIPLYGQPYISMVELGETYRMRVSYDPIIMTMTLIRGTQRLSATDLSRTANRNGTLISLSHPARMIRGAMYVPARSFLPALSSLLETELAWDASRNGIIFPKSAHSVQRVELEEREQGTLIRIALSQPLRYTTEIDDHNQLTLTIENGVLSPDAGISVPPAGMALDSRFRQRENDVQVSFLIAPDMERYDVSRATDSHDILISLRRKRHVQDIDDPEQLAESGESVLGAAGTRHLEPYFNENLWRIDTIIIDPGHGGKDSGAVGPQGTREKDVVLAVARELKRLIDERKEVNAVMTRNSDVFISLYQRANIAKQANGKLFVSIHANASRNRSAKGMEVFFLSAAKTEDAQSVADRENASVELEDNPSASRRMLNERNLLSEIERDMATNVFLKESQDLSSILLESAIPATRQINRGVKQAGFYVLAGTLPAMPSILFEIGFISNPEEERMLNRVSHQKRIAQSIYDAIITFKIRHERGLFSKSE